MSPLILLFVTIPGMLVEVLSYLVFPVLLPPSTSNETDGSA
jgi:hypothetical protein